MKPDTIVKIDGRDYMLVPVDDFTAIMDQVVIMARLAAAIVGRNAGAGIFVTPEFRAAFTEGMRSLAVPSGRDPGGEG